jgi:hypothetical protein
MLLGALVNDANTGSTIWLQVERSGMNITNVCFNSTLVGVNTYTPNNTLDVNGSIGAKDYFYLNNTAKNNKNTISFNNGTNLYKVQQVDSSSNNFLTVGRNANTDLNILGSNGYVGINTTSPGYRLDVNGDIRAYNGAFVSQYYASNTDLRIVSNNSTTNHIHINLDRLTMSGDIIMNFNSTKSNTYISNGHLYIQNGGTANASAFNVISDDRLKTAEAFITNATDTIMKLRPQLYHKFYNFDCSGSFVVESGLIAQEIYYDAPELRHVVNVPSDATPVESISSSSDPTIDPDYSSWGTKPASINYNGLIPYLIETIKELNVRILILENK